MNIPILLSKYYLGRQWSLDGDDYSGLTFLDELPPVSEEELNDKNIIYQKEMSDTEYQRLRSKEYDKEGVTIDNLSVAIWEKVVENRPGSADALQIIRQAIKNKYPKPS